VSTKAKKKYVKPEMKELLSRRRDDRIETQVSNAELGTKYWH
jgi:hypothetical protein